MTDSDHEEPMTDVVEQNTPVTPAPPIGSDSEESSEPELPDKVPLEADPADTAEQARELHLDEDDYR
jgi:hypothetical protein